MSNSFGTRFLSVAGQASVGGPSLAVTTHARVHADELLIRGGGRLGPGADLAVALGARHLRGADMCSVREVHVPGVARHLHPAKGPALGRARADHLVSLSEWPHMTVQAHAERRQRRLGTGLGALMAVDARDRFLTRMHGVRERQRLLGRSLGRARAYPQQYDEKTPGPHRLAPKG